MTTLHLLADTTGGIMSRVALLGNNDLGRVLGTVQQAIGTIRHRDKQRAAQALDLENERRASLGLPPIGAGQLQFA